MTSSTDSLYRPLDSGLPSIRLLTVRAGSEEVPIECTMFPASLEESQPYEALSYTWGDPTIKVTIKINGIDTQVTENLAGALMNLRYHSKERVLWVDAVCIDQQNIRERNHQVRQMVHVYSKAEQTVVWLGGQRRTPNRKPGSEALEMLARVGTVIRAKGLLEAFSYMAKGKAPPWVAHGSLEEYTLFQMILHLIKGVRESPHWPMIEYLSTLPWWKRGWILQEIVVAKRVTVCFGKATCSWDSIVATLSLLRQVADQNVDLLMKLSGNDTATDANIQPRLVDMKRLDFHALNMDKLRIMRSQQKNISIVDLLYMQRRAQCTLPVDKVFSSLGILGREQRSALLADYERPDVEIFREIAKFLVESSGRLDFLCLVLRLRPHRRRQDLSSWTPDWSTDLHIPLGYQPFQQPIFKASDDSVAEVQFMDDMKVMVTKGVCFDRVLRVSGESYVSSPEDVLFGMVNSTWLAFFIEHRDKIFDHYGKSESGNVWWRTIIGDQTHTESGVVRAGLGEELMWRFCLGSGELDKLLPIPDNAGLSVEERRKEASRPFFKEVARAVAERRVFVTEKGYLGLGPGNTNKGDFVCVLLGGPVPFVLRQDRDDEFVLVGEAYVHGAMSGEVMKEAEAGELVRQDFKLR